MKTTKDIEGKSVDLIQTKMRPGFTLVEMIVAVGLITVITLIVVSMLVSSLKNYRNK